MLNVLGKWLELRDLLIAHSITYDQGLLTGLMPCVAKPSVPRTYDKSYVRRPQENFLALPGWFCLPTYIHRFIYRITVKVAWPPNCCQNVLSLWDVVHVISSTDDISPLNHINSYESPYAFTVECKLRKTSGFVTWEWSLRQEQYRWLSCFHNQLLANRNNLTSPEPHHRSCIMYTRSE